MAIALPAAISAAEAWEKDHGDYYPENESRENDADQNKRRIWIPHRELFQFSEIVGLSLPV